LTTRRKLLTLLLTLWLALPALPLQAQQALDLQVTVFSTGSGPDTLAVAYAKTPSDEEMRADFNDLAGQLGGASPKLKITRDGGITVAEAELSGLTNWSTGLVNLDPLIDTYKRFGHFRAAFFFMGRFPLASRESFTRPPLRVQTRVQGAAVDYEIWVDQSGGVPGELPSVTRKPGPDFKVALGIAAIALVVAVGVFLIVYVITTHRRRAAASEGNV